MKCLQCDREAIVQEIYDGIDIRVCPVGHRTGIYQEPKNDVIQYKEVA